MTCNVTDIIFGSYKDKTEISRNGFLLISVFMVPKRKIRCPHCGFLETINGVLVVDAPTIIVRIVTAILRIVESGFPIKTSLYGSRVGFAANSVFVTLRVRADTANVP